MTRTTPVRYETEHGAQFNMIATIQRMPGVRQEDLDPEDLAVAPTTHLVGMQLDPALEVKVPEGQLGTLVETAASRILNENFAIHDCGQFDIDYRHATVDEIAATDPDWAHEDQIREQDFEDAGLAPPAPGDDLPSLE